MEYYLLDDMKIRQILENYIATDIVRISVSGYINIGIKKVWYEIDSDTLKIVEVAPASENSYALTTKGYVKWQNPSRSTEIVKSRKTTSVIVISNKYDISSADKPIMEMFCSGYICIGSLPTKQIKIDKNNIVLLNTIIDPRFPNIYHVVGVKRPNEVNVKVEENTNELIIDFTLSENYKDYDNLGIQVGKTIYVFGTRNEVFNNTYPISHIFSDIIIITIGTCFKTNAIVKPRPKRILEDEELHHLCYE